VGSSPSFGTKKKLDPAGDAGFLIFPENIQRVNKKGSWG
jgi:hypothetical protein